MKEYYAKSLRLSISILILVFLAVSMASTGAGDFNPIKVGSFNFSEKTSYNPNISFIGQNNLNVISGEGGTNFTLNDSQDNYVDDANFSFEEGSEEFDLSGASTGRGIVYQVGNETNNVSVDLVSNDHDVVGRYSSGDVNLYHWFNGSEIDLDSNDNFNLTTSSWAQNENMYKLNFTSGKDYFLGVNKTNQKEMIKARRNSYVQTPRVNDFNLTGFSEIAGTITNTTGDPVSNLNVTVKRRPVNAFGRFPYMTAPPTKYDMTDSGGNYKFTNLQPGSYYTIQVVNDSYSRTPYSGPDDRFPSGENPLARGVTLENIDLQVTNDTAEASIKLIGEEGENTIYAFFMNDGSSFQRIEAGVTPGEYTNIDVPTGSYFIFALKATYVENRSFPRIVTDDGELNVAQSGENNVEIGFPEQVKLNGTIEDDSTGEGIEGVQVYAENFTEGVSKIGRTNSDGEFSLKVKNQTNYTLRAQPGWDSDYKSNENNISVSGATEETLTLSEGPYIEGYINTTQGEVGGARISAWNGTERSYGENVSVEQGSKKGKYKIGGLKQDTNYSVFVDPPRNYTYKETQIELSGDSTFKNITLGDSSHSVSGSIQKMSNNENLNATVTIRSRELGYENTAEAQGSYSFTDLSTGPYSIRVEPDNSTFKSKRKFVYLTSDETADFQLQEFKGVTGQVQNQSSNNPVSDVLIYAYNYSEDSFDSDRTSNSGTYQLDLSSVDHSVEIWPGEDSDYMSKSTTITQEQIDGSGKDFQLSTGYKLSGEIKDGKNKLSGYISLYNESEEAYAYKEFEEGTYNLSGLKNVTYNVYISVDGDQCSSITRNVTEDEIGGTKDFSYSTNYQGPKLWVRVEDTSNNRLTNATVRAGCETQLTNSNGIAKFERQPNNQNVNIIATNENYNTSSANPKLSNTTTTSGGGTTVVDIHNETLTIENIQGNLVDMTVNVTDDTGETVSEASIAARTKDGALTLEGVTDSSGNATLEDTLPGKNYLFSVSVNDFFNSTTINNLNKGDNGEIDLGDYSLGYEVPE